MSARCTVTAKRSNYFPTATTNIFEGGNARVIGSGYAVDWRGGEHGLLVTSTRDFMGGRTYIYTADVTKESECDRMAAEAIQTSNVGHARELAAGASA